MESSALSTRHHTADVLVVGGGISGCLAAVNAAAQGHQVLLVEKAWVGGSGATCFAGGDILWWNGRDNLGDWTREWAQRGEYLLHPDWFTWACTEIHPLVWKMADWKIPYERNPDGSFVIKPGRGHNSAVVFPGYQLMRRMRTVVRQHNVRILDRISVVRLRVRGGQCYGAVGFDTRDGTLHIFTASSVVLAAGGCSFKGNYQGADNLCGEATAMALDAGVEFIGMEFANTFNSSARELDIVGMSRFQRLGGRFTNGLGETFMERYSPVYKDGDHVHVVARAMALEMRAGRGPIYFDLRQMTAENRRLSRKLLPLVFKGFESKGMDVFTTPIEWLPAYQGSMASSGGIHLQDYFGATSLPGLYAAGDVTAQMHIMGGISAPGGLNLTWAIVTGWHAGRGAGQWASGEGKGAAQAELSAAELAELRDFVYGPFRAGAEPRHLQEPIRELQESVILSHYNILRSRDGMTEALARAEAAAASLVETRVGDPHHLMLYHEAIGMAATARLMYASALIREESRGSHYRLDFPAADNQNWLKWILARKGQGSGPDIALQTQDVPLDVYRRHGIAVPGAAVPGGAAHGPAGTKGGERVWPSHTSI